MYPKTCTACGTEFTTDNIRKKLCKPGCKRAGAHKARQIKSAHNDIDFVGVDGEGVDRPDGKHEYVMLSVGDKTLWNDGTQLELQSILAFLWECYREKPNAAYVGFFLGYDFIQWLKLLPIDRARLLFDKKAIPERTSQRKSRGNPYPDAVVWEGWEIDIMAGRRFRMRPHVCHRSDWSSLCRNRTCKADLTPNGPVEHGERYEFDPDEMSFVIPEDDADSIAWNGDEKAFWGLFSSNHHIAGKGKEKVKVSGWMYVCDTGPFWQTSFLNVIKPEAWKTWDEKTEKWIGQPVCTEDEYQTVIRGKADRGHVYTREDTTYFREMVQYNILENDILARVTKRLNEGFMNERVPIKIPRTDWYGPGRAAQLWMDQLHNLACNLQAQVENRSIRQHNSISTNSKLDRLNETGLLNVDVYQSMPTWFYEAAQSSYYGGWFEQFMHGYVGDVWEYDINSAYPYVIASLPCLHTSGIHNGEYRQGAGDPDTGGGEYTLVYCTVSGSNPYIGAMPYRTYKGLISRPQKTKGWYWLHEIQASQRAGLVDDVVVERWVSYKPCKCTPPFNPSTIGIESLYQLRLDFGKNTPQGKSAKLVYNSAYGKTAQSIGSPKYSNPVYASLITAGCRTLILEAIASHPNGASDVSMVATDGIYFTSKHPSLPINKTRLGAWDETFKAGLTQLMPGVYWDDATRKAVGLGGSPKLKSRGVPAQDLAKEIGTLDFLFAQSRQSLMAGGEHPWPEIEFKSHFLLESCASALNRGKWGEAGKVTHGKSRSISSDPKTKRETVPYFDEEEGIVRSRPYVQGKDLESVPYQKSFGYLEEDTDMFPGMVGRDGEDPMLWWKELING